MAKGKNSNRKTAKSEDQQLKSSLDFDKSLIDKFAVIITDVLGSMIFLSCCVLLFAVWIVWNLYASKPFDPFPFPVLEMTVSLFAIILSVSVLINQNRQGRIDKIKQQVEFEVNVRAESEITKVLSMLHEIHQKLGLNSIEDKELEEMKENTDVKQIHETIAKAETSESNYKP